MSVRILAAAAVLTFFAALLVVMTRPSTSAVVSHEVAAVGLSNVHTALRTFQAPSVSNFSM